jgi:peptide/nickel transport system substrate-binding protein
VVPKKILALLVAVAISTSLAACGSSSEANKGNKGGKSSGGTLTLGVLVPASTQSAADARWANESPYMQAVYDTLVQLGPDAEPKPWLATKWSWNDDKTVLTMTLRDDVKFTDGTSFDADAAAKNLLRFRGGTSPNASNLVNVADAKATNATTLEITLKQPDPAVLVYLGQNAGVMESPKQFGAKDEKTKPVGSGPYVLDSAKTVIGSKYVYSRNPKYWAPDQVAYDTLILTVLPDAQTQVNAIKAGQVNGVLVVDNTTLDQIKGAGYSVVPHELDWSGLMLMDRAGKLNPALGKLEVRQAINYAIDRAAMLKAAVHGHGTVTGQIFPENSPGFDPALDDRYPFDPARAKALLSQAGYPRGFKLHMPLIQIGQTPVFDLVKQYLGDIGIKVSYTQVSINDAISAVLGAKYSASWFILQMDPTTWQQANFTYTEGATWNPFHVADPTIADLVKTVQTGDETAAADAGKKLNKYLVDQAWFAPWYRIEGNFAVDAKTNVVTQTDNTYPYLWNIKPKS